MLAAQLTTNMAANVVSPANDFSSLAPRRISYVTGGLITAVIGIADDAVEALCRCVGVHLHLADRLLEPDGRHRRHPDRRLLGRAPTRAVARAISSSWTGATPTTAASTGARSPCWCSSILPVVPGFLRAATTPGGQVASPTFLDTLYTYAWFVTFGLSFALYAILTRSAVARADCGTPCMIVTVTVNGVRHTRDVEPRLLLSDFLRQDLG